MIRGDQTNALVLKYTIRCVLLFITAFFLACSKPPEKERPVNKSLIVTAGPNVNEYNNGSNPIVIRLYQLSGRSEFEEADFWSIFNNSSEELAGIVVDRRSLSPIYPGESRLVALDIEPEAFYLAAFAEFADYETQNFRDVIVIDEEILDLGVSVSITASGVSIIAKNADGSSSKINDGNKKTKSSAKKVVKWFKGLLGGD